MKQRWTCILTILSCSVLAHSLSTVPFSRRRWATTVSNTRSTLTLRLKDTAKSDFDEPIFSSYSDFSDPDKYDYNLIWNRVLTLANISLSDLIIPLGKSLIGRQLSGKNKSLDFWADHEGNFTNSRRVSLAIEKMGPTYVKFGQALSSRSDIIGIELARALSTLQDDMDVFDTNIAKTTIANDLFDNENNDLLNQLLSTISDTPVAAASVGQVYKAYLRDYGPVAVKIKRPGIGNIVESDAQMLRFFARIIEGIPASIIGGKGKIIKTELVNGVNEFMTRLFEELDFEREHDNAVRFASLYSIKGGSSRSTLPCPYPGEEPGVIVPEMITELCSTNVLTMTWVEGQKLVDLNIDQTVETSSENLSLLVQGIQCTLSQILETGVMHADPHGANLLKVSGTKAGININRLAYIDFGIVADVPPQVRDGLICAVSYLVFQRDIKAVASLFGELRLIPLEVMDDPVQLKAFTEALQKVADKVLVYSDSKGIPSLQFNSLLEGLIGLVPRFQFQLPPYFLNNARALGTLEGMARSIDPDFNVLSVVYPFALQRLMKNPSGSPIVDQTLRNLICNSEGIIDRKKAAQILRDASLLSGVRRSVVIRDILRTKGGRKFLRSIGRDELKSRVRNANPSAAFDFEMLKL